MAENRGQNIKISLLVERQKIVSHDILIRDISLSFDYERYLYDLTSGINKEKNNAKYNNNKCVYTSSGFRECLE